MNRRNQTNSQLSENQNDKHNKLLDSKIRKLNILNNNVDNLDEKKN